MALGWLTFKRKKTSLIRLDPPEQHNTTPAMQRSAVRSSWRPLANRFVMISSLPPLNSRVLVIVLLLLL